MNKFIFTFGSGQLYAGFYQPIYANDCTLARKKMIELHGVKWSHQYTEKEWESAELKYGVLERPLQVAYCESF